MKVSLNALRFINKHHGSAGDPAPGGVDALTQKIGAQLGAVEEVIDFGKWFEGVVVAKVLACAPHPDSDHLKVCLIDDGGVVKDVHRIEHGRVQVVCGAPNARAGIQVAWLPPGATVPETAGSDEPFVLGVREVRGVTSSGMLASARELGLGDNHDGILEIADNEAQPGMAFADAFNLRGDVIIDIENKMFTHRPDCFGWLGVARELEGIQHRPYKSPDWYRLNPDFPAIETNELKLEVKNKLPKLVPRFTAITLASVNVGPSPLWLQIDLARAGFRPINNIVDYTNWYMILTGQPLHAYDYDKVKALSGANHAVITVRPPLQGEKITLLNGKEIEPRQEAIMIATDRQSIGLGGVMGGADTEVDENTKNIIVESANFDMYSTRRTAMTHGIFTDAVTRFTKGQSPLQNLAVLAKIVDEIRKFAGGKVAGAVIDNNHLSPAILERGSLHSPVKVSTDFVNTRLGFKLSAPEMTKLLTNVEFKVEHKDGRLTVTAPFWRTDIEIAEDVVEEIGRLYGYDHLPMELPARDLTPTPKDPPLELKAHVREALVKAGANELLTYSFVHGNLLDKAGQNCDHAFQLNNAISPDLQYFRTSLTPSLLEKIHPNIKAGHDEFALFEIGKVHAKGVSDLSEPAVPAESGRVALVYAAKSRDGAAYYQAKYLLEYLLDALHVDCWQIVGWNDVSVEAKKMLASEPDYASWIAPFNPKRSGFLIETGDPKGLPIGIIGEYLPQVAKGLKLPEYAAGFELFLGELAPNMGSRYRAQSRFPKVEQDICLKVPADLPYASLRQFVWNHIRQHRPERTDFTLSPVDIYQRPSDPKHKQITLRITLASHDRTLTDDEVNQLLDKVAQAAKEALKAERV